MSSLRKVFLKNIPLEIPVMGENDKIGLAEWTQQ